MARSRSVPNRAAVVALISLALTGAVRAANVPRHGAVMLDTIAPTVPRGVAADLPRSPLVDLVVNAGLRFASAAEAQRHCPADDVVQVEIFSNIYRPAESPAAGGGAFMCKAAALQEGDLPR